MAAAARRAGYAAYGIFAEVETAVSTIRQLARVDDVVLVKASAPFAWNASLKP